MWVGKGESTWYLFVSCPTCWWTHIACISSACSGAMSHVKYPPAVGIAMFPKVWQCQMVKDGQSQTPGPQILPISIYGAWKRNVLPSSAPIATNSEAASLRALCGKSKHQFHTAVFANEKSTKTTGQNSCIAKVQIKITPVRRDVSLP